MSERERAAHAQTMLLELIQLGTGARQGDVATHSPTSESILGVSVPRMRLVTKAHRTQLKATHPDDVLAIAKALIAKGTLEGRQVAYELVAGHREAARSVGARELEALGKGLDNWATVDCFATLLAGPAWGRGQLGDATVKKWVRSKDLWWRRTALASTVALNVKARGGAGDVARTLVICELLADDREDMVVKALSWALRSLVPHDPAAVRAFLVRHDAVLASRVKREVGTKLATGKKHAR